MSLPPCPDSLKSIAHYLKVADEHNDRDIVVAYWSRLYAVQVGMRLYSGNKPPEVTNLLVALMGWLESTKKTHSDNEGVTQESCAQAMIENYALKLFKYADQQDLAENYGKNVIKAFYTAGLLMDVLTTFGELSDDIVDKRKYAKWKAAYIHNCLKVGEKPVPGPPTDDKEDIFVPRSEYYSDPANVPPPADPTNVVQPPPNIGANMGWNSFQEGQSTPPTAYSPGLGPSGSAGPPVFPTPPVSSIPQIPQFPSPNVIPTPSEPNLIPSSSSVATPAVAGGSVNLDPEQMSKAQKYCKWAASALTYDDVNTAVMNLQKALNLLQTGKDE